MKFSLSDPKVAGAAIAGAVALLFSRARRRLPSALTASVLGFGLGAAAPGAVNAITERLRLRPAEGAAAGATASK